METTATQQDFIPYPTNRVVGTIADAADAHAAIEALLQAGFDRQDIDILHGEAGVDRLDPTGAEHGFLAQFQRTLIRIAGPAEEFKHLRHHIDDVRAGRIVIMVLTKEREKRNVAADILNSHGAEFVGFLRQVGVAVAVGRFCRPCETRQACRCRNNDRRTWRPTRPPSRSSMI